MKIIFLMLALIAFPCSLSGCGKGWQLDYAWIYLTGGIRCNLGKFKAMAETTRVGDIVYVDGFLVRCEKDTIVIDPAILRDPTAPFSQE
jgi:hypothetical protein